MKTIFTPAKTPWKIGVIILILIVILSHKCQAQNATAAVPVGIGTDGCGGGTQGVRELTYNSTTNILANTRPICVPSLGSVGFSASWSSVAFNPADQLLYYIRVIASGATYNSYVYRWNPYSCPGPALPVYQVYTNRFIAGIAFDKNGIGWQINFTGAAPYGLELQRIDFATGTIGAPQAVILPAGVSINVQQGDVEMTPSGQLFAVFDNNLITLNYQNYGLGPINATFINKLTGTAGNSLVALAYSDGKFVGHLMGPGCIYQEINILTGATSPVTYSSNFSAYDFTNISSSIGVAKRLVSATPAGAPGVYDISYDVYVQNFGNVPDSNVQVTDNLAAVYGAANVSNVSLSWVGAAPSGFTLNSGYNGVGTTNLLVASPTNVLKNYPVAGNNFTIRISLRVSGITAGTVYNNNATVTATGYRGVSIRDVSTNGSNPDLNNNDKSDDPGEAQPTPFVINVAPETPPCSALNTIMYIQNFGAGTGLSATMPGRSKTEYTASIAAPVPIEAYTISNNALNGDPSKWIVLSDHTGNANGRMMLVNADILGSKIFIDTVTVGCANLKYSFFGFVSFIGNSNYSNFCNAFGGFKYPKLTFAVRNAADNSIITNFTTTDIMSNAWTQYGMKFVMPTGVTKVILEIYNAGQGGCGNDLALDDIQFGLCDPQPVISINGISNGCLGGSTTINAALSDTVGMGSLLVYQWQSSTDNVTWSSISGATNAGLTLNPVTAADSKYYRLLVAPVGGIGTSCQYISNSFFLALKTGSVAPAAILKNRTLLCPGDNITLSVSGGSLGTNAVFRWYTGSCGGTLIGTGTSITVNPVVPTTYYVRAEGDCNTTSCASLTVTFNCDIDADDDGIPDVTESNNVDPKLDDDFDGIENYRDANYPGFIDSNGDGVNDNFDSDRDGVPNFLDRDSDNDGIPDVAEAGGVDANGDGKIDNYTDTDNDGFSQNVDANNTGHIASGVGLGLPDLDGDGLPNYIDLDSDNDGVPDLLEVYGTDLNNNGRIDVFSDVDGDGLADSIDGDVGNDGNAENSANALLRTGIDANNDGRADNYPNKNMDADTRPNPYDLDSDADGITDVLEAQFTDANGDGKIDGSINSNGWSVSVASLGSLVLANRDASGRANIYDIDSDDDGIPDNVEGQCTACYVLPSGLDTDGDGIDNSYDNIAGFGGRGVAIFNMDGDAFPDYIDFDTDGDGMIDIIEGNDFNFNRLPDDEIRLLNADTDGDGLDNRFDSDNSSCRGTSAWMGSGGVLSGDTRPGSITVVQKSFPTFADRDWRYMPFILNVEFLTFTASLQKTIVNLQWTMLTSEEISSFVIERSVDGQQFVAVGTVNGSGRLNEKASYSGIDNIAAVQSQKIFYRIKAIGTAGKIKYSGLVLVMSNDIDEYVKIVPNPVVQDVKVQVKLSRASKATILIMDVAGRTVYTAREHFGEGVTSIPVKAMLPNGQYTLQIITDHKTQICKFVVRH